MDFTTPFSASLGRFGDLLLCPSGRVDYAMRTSESLELGHSAGVSNLPGTFYVNEFIPRHRGHDASQDVLKDVDEFASWQRLGLPVAAAQPPRRHTAVTTGAAG